MIDPEAPSAGKDLEDFAERAREKCLKAFQKTLLDDPNSFGLRIAMSMAGERLVDTLEALNATGLAALGELSGDTETLRVNGLVRQFVEQIAGQGGLPIDEVIRQTAVRCVERLLAEDPNLGDIVRSGDSTREWRLSSRIFCLLYELFFADTIAQFIKVMITAKINLLLAGLQLIDPAGAFPDWVCEKIKRVIPSPCQEKQEGSDGGSTANLARSLVKESVQLALGLPIDTSGET